MSEAQDTVYPGQAAPSMATQYTYTDEPMLARFRRPVYAEGRATGATETVVANRFHVDWEHKGWEMLALLVDLDWRLRHVGDEKVYPVPLEDYEIPVARAGVRDNIGPEKPRQVAGPGGSRRVRGLK
jgi:hypothetical protein